MNAYIIVEGAQTEPKVYPAWLAILAPNMSRVDDYTTISDDNYYLFCSGGIPHIYDHIVNAVIDVNTFNANNRCKYDYLIICIDTEEEDREYIEKRIRESIEQAHVNISPDVQLLVFEQKVCMETWFLGNRKVFKNNPSNQDFAGFVRFFNVGIDDPQNMGNGKPERYNSKAQYHGKYLKLMLEERNMRYAKNHPDAVCSEIYLEQLISRYKDTGHLQTFGSWYEFVEETLAKSSGEL